MSVAAIGNIPTSRLQTGSLTQNQDFDEDFEEKDLTEDHDDVRIRTSSQAPSYVSPKLSPTDSLTHSQE